MLLLGALGGKRLEHTLANLCTGLGLEQRGVRVTIQDERSRVSYVLPGETRSYPKEDYFFFSVFPLCLFCFLCFCPETPGTPGS